MSFTKNITTQIVLLNIFIFILWNIYGLINPDFMIKNFLVSWESLRDGREWTLVTSIFSHTLFWHLFLNMFVLFNFGMIVENYLGAARFLRFYLVAGVSGSLFHSLLCAFVLHRPELLALGASGAISGVVLLFALLFPKEKIFILGVIPIPAIWAAIFITGLDIFGLINQTHGSTSPIGHGSHLGGAIAGLIYFIKLRWARNYPISIFE